MRNCSLGTIFVLCAQCCAQRGSVLHCVGQKTFGTVTIWVPNYDYKYKREAYGFYIPYIQEKSPLGSVQVRHRCREKGRALNICMEAGKRWSHILTPPFQTFWKNWKLLITANPKCKCSESLLVSAYADNTCCALIPVRDFNRFLLGAQKAFIVY